MFDVTATTMPLSHRLSSDMLSPKDPHWMFAGAQYVLASNDRVTASLDRHRQLVRGDLATFNETLTGRPPGADCGGFTAGRPRVQSPAVNVRAVVARRPGRRDATMWLRCQPGWIRLRVRDLRGDVAPVHHARHSVAADGRDVESFPPDGSCLGLEAEAQCHAELVGRVGGLVEAELLTSRHAVDRERRGEGAHRRGPDAPAHIVGLQ